MRRLQPVSETKGWAGLPVQRPAGNPRRPLVALSLSLLVFVFALAFYGCSSPGSAVRDDERGDKRPLIWPSPPEPARISFVMAISRPADIGASKGFFKKVVEFLLGTTRDDIIKPYGITVDSAGRVMVADTAFKRVHIYDIKNNKYSFIEGSGKVALEAPVGVSVDAEDNIYVTDSARKKVLVYGKNGRFSFDMDAGLRPTGIAVDRAAKLLYVADTGSHSIVVFDLKGKRIKTFGGLGEEDGKFNFPVDLFVDGKGELYVVDAMNYRVQIFDRGSRFLARLGRHGDGTGDFGRPKGIAVDKEGNIYVADALFDTVQIFDRSGNFLLNFGAIGNDRGAFWMPGGVFIDPADKIYVADSYNGRVQVFEYIGGAI